MNRPLLLLLQALTLLDLAFVQATGVVTGAGMALLWALALGAPLLRRLQRFAPYRYAWNGGVLLAFALLVRHATTSGLLHMLEDGLVLAVLCQVHLLNNVGARQRPDLLFFNSFLVAFVTAFFAPDLSWSVLFALHAAVLVPTLQLQAMHPVTATAIPASVLRAALRQCLPRTLLVGFVTAAAFVLVPRDFRREGWLGDTSLLRQHFENGLAERIRIDDERASPRGETVVAYIRAANDRALDVPTHWRSLAFTRFDGASWTPQEAAQLGSRFASDPAWERHADGSLQRRLPAGPRIALRVEFVGAPGSHLPTPLTAERVLADPAGVSGVEIDPRSDGGLRLLRTRGERLGALAFAVEVATAAVTTRPTERLRTVMTALPPAVVPELVHELAGQLRATLPAAPTALERAHAATDWLLRNRRYELPGGSGFARNLRAFLAGDGAGHCEYFATALALVLRVQGVPCRLVGGWLAHEWDAAANAVVVRDKHAHAWVEVLDDDGRWHTFDATPPSDVRAANAAPDGWWDALHTRLNAWWSAIAAFDQAARARLLDAILALPRRQPFACVAIAGVVVLVVLRRRRGRQPVEVAALLRSLRAAGVTLRAGETPREAIARAIAAPDADAARLAAVRAAAEQHERRRYAGC